VAAELPDPITRLLIADDHQIVRAGLRHILESHPNWEVVAEASDGKEAVRKAIESKPDIAIIDYSLPIMNGIEVTRRIREHLEKTEVLIFTVHENEALIEEILKAGARGYLLKSDANKNIIEAVETLERHKPYFTNRVSETLLHSFLARQSIPRTVLTDRERGVVQLIAEGYTTKQIAHLLGISPKTVESHRSAIMRKLNLTSSAELVRYAIRNRIVEP
jgi:DNA-binding NarL/FixJ family response regulator